MSQRKRRCKHGEKGTRVLKHQIKLRTQGVKNLKTTTPRNNNKTGTKYKVVHIWPGQTVTCLHTNSPRHIWTNLYYVTQIKSIVTSSAGPFSDSQTIKSTGITLLVVNNCSSAFCFVLFLHGVRDKLPTTFRKPLWVMSKKAVSETSSVNSPLTPCKNPKTKKHHSLHGGSLKSKLQFCRKTLLLLLGSATYNISLKNLLFIRLYWFCLC